MITAENPRKIAFVGTGCVGKTTIFDHYQEKYRQDPKVAFVEEAAREYFGKNQQIPVHKRFGVGPQSEIQDLALKREREAHASEAQRIICERSTIDAVVYVYGHGDKEGSKRLLDKIEFWLPTYHSILLLNPADVPYETDEIRKESPDVRLRNHDAFLEVFMEAGITYELLSGTEEQRIKRVDQILQS